MVFIDQLTSLLYNNCCKIFVKVEGILRLFIVEDEKEICDTVAKSLYDAGYEVDTCYDGEEALAGILTENYDLVVLDLNLPGMDGMEILKELRQENEETKVLILSARGQIADKVEALVMAGFVYLIEKKGKAWVDSFSIAGSMIIGMTAAVLVGLL